MAVESSYCGAEAGFSASFVVWLVVSLGTLSAVVGPALGYSVSWLCVGVVTALLARGCVVWGVGYGSFWWRTSGWVRERT